MGEMKRTNCQFLVSNLFSVSALSRTVIKRHHHCKKRGNWNSAAENRPTFHFLLFKTSQAELSKPTGKKKSKSHNVMTVLENIIVATNY